MTAAFDELIEVVAHRGMGSAFVMPDEPPENTLPSFEAAWIAGSDACEIDVHLTRDNQVVGIHDATTGRTSDVDLEVSRHTLAELQQIDVGHWKGERWGGSRIPLLSDVLSTVPEGHRLFVEIKTGPEIVSSLANAIRDSGRFFNEVVIISFNPESLKESKVVLPDLRHFLLVEFELDSLNGEWKAGVAQSNPGTREVERLWQQPADIPQLVDAVRQHGFDGLDVSAAQPDNFFGEMQAAGIEWMVWTVDNPDVAVEVANRGATSITTNRLLAITQALQTHGFRTGPASRRGC